MINTNVGLKTSKFSLTSCNLLLAIAAGLASAAFFYLGTGLHPIWGTLWVAPVPILAIAPRLHSSGAFFLGSIAWLIGEMNQWSYLTCEIEMPTQIVIFFFIITAVIFGVGVLFTRSFLRRGWLFLASLAFPVYWVMYEYLAASASPHSTFGNLAYTQMNCLPLIQIASITGVWGISFIVFLFAGATATLLSGAGKPWQRRALAIAVGFIVCAVLAFGKWRLHLKPQAQPVAVTLIAKEVPKSVYLGMENQALELLHAYADEVRHLIPLGTEAVVLPEKIGRVSDSTLSEVDALFSSAATATRSAIVLGLVRRTASGAFNSSRLYSSEGKLEANHDKHHLLPGVEPEKPGDKRSNFRSAVPGSGDCKFARIWISRSSAANMHRTV
jgi:apolipoprotein N-acyltransferase